MSPRCPLKSFVFTLLFTLLLPSFVWANVLKVYGYVEGHKEPQLLNAQQIEKIKTITHNTIPTWLAIVSDLHTNDPKLHLIDTEYFQKYYEDNNIQYGLHQSYAQYMNIVSSAPDFISKLKADGRPREIMPFTFYVPNAKITKNGIDAQWVLQNRRYIFKDDSVSFAATMDVSAQLFQSSMGGIVSGNPFIITYNQSVKANGKPSNRRPNLKTALGQQDNAVLKGKGYEVVTEPEMATLAGETPPLAQVHNGNDGNEAYGYLKVVRTEDDMNDLTPQHIAIFPSLPDRIPPVAAIVTLEEQTELSHINVLAINRGTLNIAVAQAATGIIGSIMAKSNELSQRPVKLKISGESINITESNDAQVAAFQNKLKEIIGEVKIPLINVNGKIEIVKPTEDDSPSTVGAKAANYGKIERILGNELVHQGFAIDFDLYRTVVTQGGADSIEEKMIKPLIKNVQDGKISPRQANQELGNIRAAIQNAEIPEDIINALISLSEDNDKYGSKGKNEKIRFRSSTNCEDLPRFNGAGLYLSEGIKLKHLRRLANPEKKQESIIKVRETLMAVLASLWLPRAFWEREYFSIRHQDAALAVQINPSFTDELANGVIIANESEGKINYWINSQFGEASVTNPGPGEIPESIKFKSSGTYVSAILSDLEAQPPAVKGTSNIAPVFLNNSGTLSTIKAPIFAELLMASQTVLNSLITDKEKFGIDIEFKLMIENGNVKLYLKQARPLNLSVGH